MNFQLLLTLAFIVGFGVFALIVGYIIYRRGWESPRPDEALVIVGRAKGDSKAIVQADDIAESAAEAIREEKVEGLEFEIRTAACWVNPVTKKAYKLPLDSRSTDFEVTCHDKEKIEVKVRGNVLYKVGDNFPAMRAAARRFMNMNEQTLNANIESVMTGQVRALVGTMTIPELITDRQTLLDKVRETTKDDMAKLGLSIDTLTIQELWDDNQYITNLGKPQAENVARQASVAADQARTEREKATQEANLAVAEAERDTAIKTAGFKAQQDTELQKAEQAGPLAKAEAERAVVEKETEVARLEAAREESRLEATVRKPADAARYKAEQEAEAASRSEVLKAKGQAEAKRELGKANAEAAQAEGQAEAEVIKAKGLAEAEATEKKAKALADNGDALVQMKTVEQLPEVAKAVAGPLAEVDNLVLLDGPEGLAKTVIGGITATGAAVANIKGLTAANRAGDDANPDQEKLFDTSAVGVGASKALEAGADILERMATSVVSEADGSDLDLRGRLGDLEGLLSAVGEHGEGIEQAQALLDRDPDLSKLARSMAHHPDRAKAIRQLGLTGNAEKGANVLLDGLFGDLPGR